MKFEDFTNANEKNRSFMIAEAGVNHENSIEKAILMIKQAAEAGADAIKFQTYKANSLASTQALSYWDNEAESETSQFELFSKYDKFDYKDYEKLKFECDQNNIQFSTTIFDYKDVSKYNDLLSFYKIASADINNICLHQEIAKYNKPVILSTGASSLSDIDESVHFYRKSNIPVSLLHCVLNYPCEPQHALLNKISYLKKVYPDLIIGYSDHVPTIKGNLHLHIARMQGAEIIEKHFTYDKQLPGNDHYHSFDFDDLLRFREEEKFVNHLNFKGSNDLENQQDAIKHARRSIVAGCDINVGDEISDDNIQIKRPGTGIGPNYLGIVKGMKATCEIPFDTPLSWDFFK